MKFVISVIQEFEDMFPEEVPGLHDGFFLSPLMLA